MKCFAPAKLTIQPASLMKMDCYEGHLQSVGSNFKNHVHSASLTKMDRLYDSHFPSNSGDCVAEAPPSPSRHAIKVKHTFIDVDTDETPAAGLRRSNSAPALLCQLSDVDASNQDMLSAFSDDESTAASTDPTEESPSEQEPSGMDHMEELHRLGECNPCAYFAFKVDGCRKGADCERCHLCSYDEIQYRMRELKKSKKAMRKLQQQEEWQAEENQWRPRKLRLTPFSKRGAGHPRGGRPQEANQAAPWRTAHEAGQECRRRAQPVAAPQPWPDAAPVRMAPTPTTMAPTPMRSAELTRMAPMPTRMPPPVTFGSTPAPSDCGVVFAGCGPVRRTLGDVQGCGPVRRTLSDYASLGVVPSRAPMPAASREWQTSPAPVRGGGFIAGLFGTV